jgi:hypothetical protein
VHYGIMFSMMIVFVPKEKGKTMREKLIELLCTCSCHGNGESLGSCPDRKHGMCGEVADLSYCVIQNLANHLIANGVTVLQWKQG